MLSLIFIVLVAQNALEIYDKGHEGFDEYLFHEGDGRREVNPVRTHSVLQSVADSPRTSLQHTSGGVVVQEHTQMHHSQNPTHLTVHSAEYNQQ